MNTDVDAICGTEYGERSPDRINSRNGYQPPRALHTRAGTLCLDIPKLWKGSYPSCLLEFRKRSERGIAQAISETWVSGLSTRKMDCLVRTLAINEISKSTISEMAKSLDEKVKAFRTRPLQNGPCGFRCLDATMAKYREFGSVENVTVVIAVRLIDVGTREILGVEVFTSEDETTRDQYNKVADRLCFEHPPLTDLLDSPHEEVMPEGICAQNTLMLWVAVYLIVFYSYYDI